MGERATLTVQHTYACPPAAVFDAWLDPALARRWLFATPEGRNVRCEIDARPGGSFVITDRRDGDDVEHDGTYVEIDRPRRLVFTFSVPKYSSDVSTVTVLVSSTSAGTELTLINHDVPIEWAKQSEQGWRDLLATLEAILAA